MCAYVRVTGCCCYFSRLTSHKSELTPCCSGPNDSFRADYSCELFSNLSCIGRKAIPMEHIIRTYRLTDAADRRKP